MPRGAAVPASHKNGSNYKTRGLYQYDQLGLWEMDIAQIAQELGIIDLGAPVGHRHMPLVFKRCKTNEKVGRAAAAFFASGINQYWLR